MVDAYVIGDGIVELAAALELAEVGLRVRIAPRLGADAEVLDERGLRDPAGELAGFLAHVASPLSEDDPAASAAQPVQSTPAQLFLLSASGAWLPQPVPAVLGMPAVPFSEQALAILGGGAATRAYLDRIKPVLTIGKTHELGKLVRARFGRKTLDVLVEPLVRELVGVGADEAEVAVVAPGLNEALTRVGSLSGAVLSYSERGVARETRVRPAGGWQALRTALIARLSLYEVEFAAAPPSAVTVGDDTWLVTEPGSAPYAARALVAGARLGETWVPFVAPTSETEARGAAESVDRAVRDEHAEASAQAVATGHPQAAAAPADPADPLGSTDQADPDVRSLVDPVMELGAHRVRAHAYGRLAEVGAERVTPASAGADPDHLPTVQTVTLSDGELWSVRVERQDEGVPLVVLAGPSHPVDAPMPESSLAELRLRAKERALEAVAAAGLVVSPDSIVAQVSAAPYTSAAQRDADEARLAEWRTAHHAILPVGEVLHGDDIAAAIADARLAAVQLRRRLAGIAE